MQKIKKLLVSIFLLTLVFVLLLGGCKTKTPIIDEAAEKV